MNKFEVLQKEQMDAKSKLTAEKEKLQRYDKKLCIDCYYVLLTFKQDDSITIFFLVY